MPGYRQKEKNRDLLTAVVVSLFQRDHFVLGTQARNKKEKVRIRAGGKKQVLRFGICGVHHSVASLLSTACSQFNHLVTNGTLYKR